MKKIWIVGVSAILIAGVVVAGPMADHPNLKKAFTKAKEAITLLEVAQGENNYDMGGHIEKAKSLLQQAQNEIYQAAEYVNNKK